MDILQKLKSTESEAKALNDTLQAIDRLAATWLSGKENRSIGAQAVQNSIEATIAASLALENITYSPAQIHKILTSGTPAEGKREKLVTGYNTILNALYADARKYPLCEDTIVALHTALFPGGNNRHERRAAAKPAAVNFLDYKAPTLFNRGRTVSVNNEIRDLVEWTNLELSHNKRHPLVIIAAFAYEFISIHPFREGKGELSRILSTLLLLQNGQEWAREVSVDRFIEQRRTAYYHTLKRGQQNRYSAQENITAWVLFLCDIWLQALRSLGPDSAQADDTSTAPAPTGPASTTPPAAPGTPATPPIYLNARQKQILALLEEAEPAKVSDITHALKTISINTIKKDLLYLRQNGLIESYGVLKGTIYSLKK